MKIASFKPEFGNENHIRIAEMVFELRKKEEKLEKNIDAYMGLRNLKKEIKSLESEINRLIEIENN